MDDKEIIEIITKDEFAGQGGSYLLDPETGKRIKIEEKKAEAEAAKESKK